MATRELRALIWCWKHLGLIPASPRPYPCPTPPAGGFAILSLLTRRPLGVSLQS